jgi:anti-anti-sigma factor
MRQRAVGDPVVASPDWLAVLRNGESHVLRPLKPALLCGDLDHVVRRVEALVAAGGRHFVVHLSGVDDIDGACIGGLVRSYRIVRECGGSLHLAGLHPWVRRMIELAGVTRIVPVLDDASELECPADAPPVRVFHVSCCA